MTTQRLFDLIIAVFFLAVGILGILGVRGLPFQDQLFPVTASVGITLCAAIYLLRLPYAAPRRSAEAGDDDRALEPENIGTLLHPALALLGLGLGVYLLGFLIAPAVFVLTYILSKGGNRLAAVFCSLLILAFVWGLLIKTMHLALPEPLLAPWLGGFY